MPIKNIQTGAFGEHLAAQYLQRMAYVLLEKNWRFKHWEVDIIAHKANVLHIVEVKTRTSDLFGNPEESISKQKMQHLKNASEEYLHQHPEWTRIQFDVIAITLLKHSKHKILMIEDVYF